MDEYQTEYFDFMCDPTLILQRLSSAVLHRIPQPPTSLSVGGGADGGGSTSSSAPPSVVTLASQLSEMVLSLHDGSDYVDDCMALITALLEGAPTASICAGAVVGGGDAASPLLPPPQLLLLAMAHVCLAGVRLLAYFRSSDDGDDYGDGDGEGTWDSEPYAPIVRYLSDILTAVLAPASTAEGGAALLLTAADVDAILVVVLKAVDGVFEVEDLDEGDDFGGCSAADTKAILKFLGSTLRVPDADNNGNNGSNGLGNLSAVLQQIISGGGVVIAPTSGSATAPPSASPPSPALVEVASTLVVRLPKTAKRSRDDDGGGGKKKGAGKKKGGGGADATTIPKGLPSLTERLVALTTTDDTAAPQSQYVAPILKAMDKVLREAAFEAMDDICDEDLESLGKVLTIPTGKDAEGDACQTALLDQIERAVVSVLTGGGADAFSSSPAALKALPFAGLDHAETERCGSAHWDRATSVLASVLAIRSSPRLRERGDGPSAAAPSSSPSSPSFAHSLCVLMLAWSAHRYHIGSEFEVAEAFVAFAAKRNEALWRSLRATDCPEPSSMPWTCVADPFAAQQ